jgi:hypothetical protein
MEGIVIRDVATLRDAESIVAAVQANPAATTKVYANELGKRRGALYDGALLQAMITWARKSENKTISFSASRNLEEAISELSEYSVGVATSKLSKIIKIGDAEISRRQILLCADERLKKIEGDQFDKVLKGRCLDLICVSGSPYQYIDPLFEQRTRMAVKLPEDMKIELRKIFNLIYQGSRKQIDEKFLAACGVFSHELIKNTQDHAIKDIKGMEYDDHVEGVLISFGFLGDQAEPDFMENASLREFWARECTSSDNGVKSIRCFQMAFFDSGPGLVGRFKGVECSQLSLEEERKYLIESIKKNASSKSVPAAGSGLPDVLLALQRIGGLIRIRSGRHSIFNAFAPDDYRSDIYDFKDWSGDELSGVEGALISIILPVRREQK